ncbi:uncharacterized protein ACN2A1_000505 [Glossina fuscipes fuscipes]
MSTIQLTLLWEHILKTRQLPESLCPHVMFTEFLERLRDPEWQVRQHALRVLVDVLVIMRSKADLFMGPIVPQLLENLAHQVPAVRKGSLDCIRVYLTETEQPDTVMLMILDIGLKQKIPTEPYGARLTCAVMLSLPALIQVILFTKQKSYIIQNTVDMLLENVGHATHQEVALKVLKKISELLRESEFQKYLSDDSYQEFELLCNLYGICNDEKGETRENLGKRKFLNSENSTSAWRLIASKTQPLSSCRRSSKDEESHDNRFNDQLDLNCTGKIIMETEIKINDDTLTMRILEAKSDDDVSVTNAEEMPKKPLLYSSNRVDNEIVYGRLNSARNIRDNVGLVQLLSDSDDLDNGSQTMEAKEGSTSNQCFSAIVTPSTPIRTSKRVTFGGEIVKMRTPDSDVHSNNNINKEESQLPANQQKAFVTIKREQPSALVLNASNENHLLPSTPAIIDLSKTTALSLEIPNDNTKPLVSPKCKNQPHYLRSPLKAVSSSPIASMDKDVNINSPKTTFKRLSLSPVDGIISPRTDHKEVEVLHNLQRDPSPNRSNKLGRPNTPQSNDQTTENLTNVKNTIPAPPPLPPPPPPPPPPPEPPKSWEDLNIVDDNTLWNLRSGNWRHRLKGVLQLEEALRSSENLAYVQPCLDSLLRTLLSSECKHEVAEAKHNLLINLITRLPLDNLEDRTMQIMNGLCRQSSAGANRVFKVLMHRLPPASIVLKLISQEFLHVKSSRFREHALQFVAYALMTFPSTCFDTKTCVTNATYAALNRKRRVRQAALDVLAVLGHITSIRNVLAVVEQIVNPRDDAAALVAAVKARLSRKLLPVITNDDVVKYTLHLPPTHLTDNYQKNNHDLNNCNIERIEDWKDQLGADIDWIKAGVESVSPTALKRRSYPSSNCSQQSFSGFPTAAVNNTNVNLNCNESYIQRFKWRPPADNSVHGTVAKNYSNVKKRISQMIFPYVISSKTTNDLRNNMCMRKTNLCDIDQEYPQCSLMPAKYKIKADNCNNNFQYIFDTNPTSCALTYKKPNVAEYLKSFSESSIDERSSDSTYTSSGGSNGSNDITTGRGVAAAPNESISGRFTRQVINSRFPAMDSNYLRVHKPPTYYPGMGAYAHLHRQQLNMNATYPKINYTLPSQSHMTARRRIQNQHYPQTQQQQQQQKQQSPPYYYINNNANRMQHFNHYTTNQPHYHHYQQQQQQQQHQQTQKSNCTNQETFKQLETTSLDDLTTANNNCSDCNLNSAYTIYSNAKVAANSTATNGRRFVKMEKILTQNDKSSQAAKEKSLIETRTTEEFVLETDDREPSVKSINYSQKSTTSALSSDNSEKVLKSDTQEQETASKEQQNSKSLQTPIKEEITLEDHIKKKDKGKDILELKCESELNERTDSLRIKAEINDKNTPMANDDDDVDGLSELITEVLFDNNSKDNRSEAQLERNDSLISLQSKTESIKTQLDDTTPIMSRTQSTKSLIIDEDLDADNRSNTSAIIDENDNQKIGKSKAGVNKSCSRPNTGNRCSSPTIVQLKTLSKRNSIVKSLDSVYERQGSKPESCDNSTETSSQSSNAQLNNSLSSNALDNIALEPTLLKKKSNSSLFLKRHRKISPAKQTVKITQAELFPSTLQRLEKPRESLIKSFDQLDSSNWEMIMLGLKNMVRLIRYHKDCLESQMHMICIQLTRSVRNLRSQVARAACQASTELFTLKSRFIESECDDLVCALLHRTADTNRFLRADATRALESMIDNFTPSKVLNILNSKGAIHQNALVRTTTAKLLNRLVERLGCDKIYSMPREQRDKFFLIGANLLLEGSLETRSYAKSIFKMLSQHPNYNRLLLEIIPSRTYRNVEKTLRSIR